MDNIFFRLLFCLFFSSVFLACQDNNSEDLAKKGVHIVGHQYSSNTSIPPFAQYWRNGSSVPIGNETTPSVAKSIFVDGNDVYIAGYFPGAIYWKNGVAFDLPDGEEATSIFVEHGDVHVVGNQGGDRITARYWKNGVGISLTDRNKFLSEANSVYVSEGDVYIAGFQNDIYLETQLATLWKNGVATNLTEGKVITIATSVFVNGNDVYVAGVSDFNALGHEVFPFTGFKQAIVWKNGVASTLSDNDGTKYFGATSVFVSGDDVYVAGWGGEVNYQYHDANGNPLEHGMTTIAKYWKNGIAITLEGDKPSAATSIFVFQGDVYVAGYDAWGPRYWKNGVAIPLSPSNSFPRSIFVN